MALEILAKIIAPLITAIVGFLIKRHLEAKPRLLTYLVHASAIPLNDENETIVNTHSIVVRNSGKKTAHNVRIGHNHLPTSYQIYPALTHEIKNGPNDAAEILIPTLVPNEEVSITYLYFPPKTWNQINSYCKSEEGSAQAINVIPSPKLSKLVITLFWSMVFIGASTTLYWLVLLLAEWVK